MLVFRFSSPVCDELVDLSKGTADGHACFTRFFSQTLHISVPESKLVIWQSLMIFGQTKFNKTQLHCIMSALASEFALLELHVTSTIC